MRLALSSREGLSQNCFGRGVFALVKIETTQEGMDYGERVATVILLKRLRLRCPIRALRFCRTRAL
jgi:hypothetical protein